MSLTPAFKIGLSNAWVFMVLLFSAGFTSHYIDKEKTKKRMEGEPTGSELEKATKIANVIAQFIILPFTLIYSIFLPLKLGTLWFFASLPIYVLGLVMVLMYGISFSTAPLGEPISKGVYAISRHPAYFGSFLGYVGVGIACASWVFLLCALVWIVSCHFGAIEEERFLHEKYGDAYREYVNRTPRWIGFSKTK
jgi:protein-S-isoprenylcysteine O-methyltransferase Ste14